MKFKEYLNESNEKKDIEKLIGKKEILNVLKKGLEFNNIWEKLFDYYSSNGLMPYGTQKARDGDPMEWIENRLENIFK